MDQVYQVDWSETNLQEGWHRGQEAPRRRDSPEPRMYHPVSTEFNLYIFLQIYEKRSDQVPAGDNMCASPGPRRANIRYAHQVPGGEQRSPELRLLQPILPAGCLSRAPSVVKSFLIIIWICVVGIGFLRGRLSQGGEGQ